jgi:hypothetical protein
MKKIITTIILSLFTLCSFAQFETKITTYKNCYGRYNEYKKKYDFDEFHYAEIVFTFYEKYITVDDIGHSLYRITETLPIRKTSNSETRSVKCLDENNKECVFAIMSFDDGTASIGVIYDEKMFVYVIKTKNIE